MVSCLTDALREARVHRCNGREEETAVRHHSVAKKRPKLLLPPSRRKAEQRGKNGHTTLIKQVRLTDGRTVCTLDYAAHSCKLTIVIVFTCIVITRPWRGLETIFRGLVPFYFIRTARGMSAPEGANGAGNFSKTRRYSSTAIEQTGAWATYIPLCLLRNNQSGVAKIGPGVPWYGRRIRQVSYR